MELMYTPEEAAEMLKLNPETIRRALRDGRLRGNQFGRVWRIPESALKAWIDDTSNAKGESARLEKAG
jgi:excisionase family DNA binding protein